VTGKFDPTIHCCVCGYLLSSKLTRHELLAKGLSHELPDGSRIYFCYHHTQEEIAKMAGAVPGFTRASDLKKGLLD